MKKTALALALMAGFTGAAFAQTSVTVYGIVDAGIVSERGGATGNLTKLTSGVASGSRLGFKGTEDLGGGLSALFLMENGFAVDNGTATQGGVLFGRQAYVGLGSNAGGTVTLGRQYTPQYLTLVMADPFATGMAGDAANLMPNTGDAASRMNNSIKYATPNFAGFTGELAYGFGEVQGDNKAKRQYGLAVGYGAGPLAVRLGYHNRDNTGVSTDNAKNTLLAGTYDFKVAKLHLAYGVNKGVNSSPIRGVTDAISGANTSNPYARATAPTFGSSDSRDALIGVTVPFGPHTFLASYINKNDKSAANQDANQWALGYRYALSKRTDLYAAYARINNKNNASYTVGSAIETGSGDKAFNLGVRHTF